MPSRKIGTSRQPSTRLTRTLALLIGCMSVGAWLLNQIHDRADPAGDHRAARTSLRSTGASWKKIAISAAPGNASDDLFHHFHIDEGGAERSSPAWEHGQQDAQSSQTVYVLVSHNPRTEGITRRQWNALVARLKELQTRYHIPRDGISLAAPAERDSPLTQIRLQQLTRMLQTAGLL